MKTITTLLLLFLIVCISNAQNEQTNQKIKYITNAPDGSIALTIYDDSRDDSMKLEAADTFYKYQILDPHTNEPILSSRNSGKKCKIDKNKFAAGTYNIRLFTHKFVITSQITIKEVGKLNKIWNNKNDVALNESDQD